MEKLFSTYMPALPSIVRLDQYLIETYRDYSRTYFQKLIEMGNVKVNGVVARKVSMKLKPTDQVAVTLAITHTYAFQPQALKLEIIFEHEDFLVVNKPAGLLVHPASTTHETEPTLVHGLLHYFKEVSAFSDQDRPGIVHRLDKDTSGVILVARTQQAQVLLSAMFKDRLMTKTYCAIVRGEPLPEGSINYPIGRHPQLRHKMSHVGIASRDALTHYRTIAYADDYAVVLASPVTGRTHQIRVHFAAIGHGLLGDAVYGYQSKLIQRQALHAQSISFTYKGQAYSFSAPLPEDMQRLMVTTSLNS